MIVKRNELLIEVFADDGKLLDLGENDLGENVYAEYACLPKNYNPDIIREINKEDKPIISDDIVN